MWKCALLKLKSIIKESENFEFGSIEIKLFTVEKKNLNDVLITKVSRIEKKKIDNNPSTFQNNSTILLKKSCDLADLSIKKKQCQKLTLE